MFFVLQNKEIVIDWMLLNRLNVISNQILNQLPGRRNMVFYLQYTGFKNVGSLR